MDYKQLAVSCDTCFSYVFQFSPTHPHAGNWYGVLTLTLGSQMIANILLMGNVEKYTEEIID